MKLKWALTELRKNPKEPFLFSGEADLKTSLMARNDRILDATPVHIEGVITPENFDQFLVSATLQLTLTLPSTRSLEPTQVPLTLDFMELYVSPDQRVGDPEEELVFQLEKDSIDLQKPIEDTILSSLPVKVLTEAEKNGQPMPSGNDWEMLSEEDYENNREEVEATDSHQPENSPFAVLKDLFPEEDE